MTKPSLAIPATKNLKKRVPFVAKLKGAREVILTGDFSGWSKDSFRLGRKSEDEWRTDLRLAPGEYQYRLLVDGEWRDHAEAPKRVPNPFGSENCVLTVV